MEGEFFRGGEMVEIAFSAADGAIALQGFCRSVLLHRVADLAAVTASRERHVFNSPGAPIVNWGTDERKGISITDEPLRD
jgi:hypothetical protein